MSTLTVIVHHLPAPQGSKRHVGGGRMIESSQHVAGYRDAVTAATLTACQSNNYNGGYSNEPLSVYVVFTLPRPAGHYRIRKGDTVATLVGNARPAPSVKPDLDKLLRATLDGLVDGGAIHDDYLIVAITAAKTYPGGHLDALDTPGAVIHLQTQEA